jgi:hypothetical protein
MARATSSSRTGCSFVKAYAETCGKQRDGRLLSRRATVEALNTLERSMKTMFKIDVPLGGKIRGTTDARAGTRAVGGVDFSCMFRRFTAAL